MTLSTITPSVLGQPGPIAPPKPQNPKQPKYRFICWRCGAFRHLTTYHGPGGLLRICPSCARKVGLS